MYLQKINTWDITFKELYDYNQMTLILTGSDISNSKTVYYNVETTKYGYNGCIKNNNFISYFI